MGLTWSTANALGRYGVTANAIMPSGATRMIDSTPRGKAFFEEHGKWPSEMAVGTERDPDNVAPLVVYLASDAAANVNGQVFHSYGYGYTLLEQPHAVRSIRVGRPLGPGGAGPDLPRDARREPEAAAGGGFGTKLDERPAEEWTEIAPGRRFWKSPWEDPQEQPRRSAATLAPVWEDPTPQPPLRERGERRSSCTPSRRRGGWALNVPSLPLSAPERGLGGEVSSRRLSD